MIDLTVLEGHFSGWIGPTFLLGSLILIVVLVVFLLRRRSRHQKIQPPRSDIPISEEITTVSVSESATMPSTSGSESKVVSTERYSLSKSSGYLRSLLKNVFSNSSQINWESLEDALILADLGVSTTGKIISQLRSQKVSTQQDLQLALPTILKQLLLSVHSQEATLADTHKREVSTPRVVMFVGVNGVGKTTTLAKYAFLLKNKGRKVLVGAGDTFRAAAVEQLQQWAERIGVEGIYQQPGSDPAAVAFDSVQAAVSRHYDDCLVDTAGRLHNKQNLMNELSKVKRVMGKVLPEAPHEVWLVVDGTTGQNALDQARIFNEAVQLTGVIVTKLDGSAKGGIVVAISSELGVPIRWIGIGETAEDLIPFEPNAFVDTLLKDVFE